MSSRSKRDWLLPASCTAVNSGGSRYRSVRMPETDRKLPAVWLPPPTFATTCGLLNDPYPSDTEPVGLDWPSPNFVTTSTTSLLFSPYPAAAPPVLTSIDSTTQRE